MPNYVDGVVDEIRVSIMLPQISPKAAKKAETIVMILSSVFGRSYRKTAKQAGDL